MHLILIDDEAVGRNLLRYVTICYFLAMSYITRIRRIKLNQISQVTNPQQKTDFFSWKKIDFNECKILLVEDVKENQDVVIGLLRKTKIKIKPKNITLTITFSEYRQCIIKKK